MSTLAGTQEHRFGQLFYSNIGFRDPLTSVQQIRDERDRLSKAIDALEGQGGHGRTASSGKKTSGGITAAGRKKLSEMMKARWAARRAQAAGKAAKKSSAKKK